MIAAHSLGFLLVALVLGPFWNTALGSDQSILNLSQSIQIDSSAEVTGGRAWLPRMMRMDRTMLYGTVLVSGGQVAPSFDSVAVEQKFCLLNLFYHQQDQTKWQEKRPFTLGAEEVFSAPLLRLTPFTSEETLEFSGNSKIVTLFCLQKINDQESVPLALSSSLLTEVFGEVGTWNLPDLPANALQQPEAGTHLQPEAGTHLQPEAGTYFVGPPKRLIAFGPPIEKPITLIKGKTQIVTDSGAIAAGWLNIGDLDGAIERIAFDAGVTILTEGEARIAGRVVSWKVRGTQEAVDRFNREIQEFIRANQPATQ